jgi:hypothetical protein
MIDSGLKFFQCLLKHISTKFPSSLAIQSEDLFRNIWCHVILCISKFLWLHGLLYFLNFWVVFRYISLFFQTCDFFLVSNGQFLRFFIPISAKFIGTSKNPLHLQQVLSNLSALAATRQSPAFSASPPRPLPQPKNWLTEFAVIAYANPLRPQQISNQLHLLRVQKPAACEVTFQSLSNRGPPFIDPVLGPSHSRGMLLKNTLLFSLLLSYSNLPPPARNDP